MMRSIFIDLLYEKKNSEVCKQNQLPYCRKLEISGSFCFKINIKVTSLIAQVNNYINKKWLDFCILST